MSSLQLTEFVKRPSAGRTGKMVNVRSNFFEVTKLPTVVTHYDISISSDMPPPVNRRIFEQLVKSDRTSDLGGVLPVFDGRRNLFSTKELPFESRTFDVTLSTDFVPRSNRPIPMFKVKIKKVATINLEELQRFLNGKAALSNNCLTAVMSLNILIHHQPAMLYATFGRSFYTPHGSQTLAGSLEVWQGFYQSVRPTTGKMMVNVDVTATAFFQGIPLLEMVVKILGLRSLDDLHRPTPPLNWVKVERAIKRLRITVTHREKSTRSFKITGLTEKSALDETFKCQIHPTDPEASPEEEVVSIVTYFKNAYNRVLNFPMLRCVRVGKVVLPMEVCKVIPGQRYPKKLDEAQTADMIKFTSKNPATRANTIKNGLQILDFDNNEYLKEAGMKVSNEMVVVPARVFPAPTVCYHPSSRESSFKPKDGAWNLRDKKLIQGGTLESWGVLVFGTERDCSRVVLQGFIRELILTCQDTGMNVVNREPPVNYANPLGDIEAALKGIWMKAGNMVKSMPQLIVCVLPNTGTPLYAEIKRVTDTVIGVSSQCVQMKHIQMAKRQYCANVCLKMNVKIGGVNVQLSSGMLDFVTTKPTIIIGVDVTHPHPSDYTHPSIAAAVASLDNRAARYATAVRVQKARTETVADLSNMTIELLKKYYQACGQKPERILVYRDGVSEGQFSTMLKTEVASIRAGCHRLEANYNPKVTYVVVQKRHHARFFPMNSQSADRSGNCQPGTCVDTTIVHPFEFDFYIQSHAGLLGTSRPTHYQVLQDDNNFTSDDLQCLTYNLCHLYARATRTVSIVPAVYYAHIVAARARFHAKGEHWSDNQSTESGTGADMTVYAAVKPELDKVMWFM
ncbi:eukaryotic translation initiation factor 2C, 2 [Mortierella antarctica]|nr:eukaryotic translation initiation factor 2C, 2 [Mortierella antarctica]